MEVVFFVLLDRSVHLACIFQYRRHLLGSTDLEGVLKQEVLLRKPFPRVSKGRTEMSATLILQLLLLLCTHLQTRLTRALLWEIKYPGSCVIEDCLPWMEFPELLSHI